MVFHESALREYVDPTGKRSAVKVACCVWKGGKAVRPYLSLLTAKIYQSAQIYNFQTFTLLNITSVNGPALLANRPILPEAVVPLSIEACAVNCLFI